jgi:NAD(P)-dependent dehydrogenase (short-subunit alcohol dehydrogenase family)
MQGVKMLDMNDKVGIVTGAGRGIGRAIAIELAKKGMLIGVNDVDPKTSINVVNEIRAAGGKAIPLIGSVSSMTQVDAMFSRVEKELGPLWLLVNNAGVINASSTAEMTEQMWDTVFEVDAKGVFVCSQAAIRRMLPRQAGRIVNISSIAGMIVRTGQIAYCSAKAAVIHFSRCLAVEMASYGITVNCLCPGMTWTSMLQETLEERGVNLDEMVKLIPSGNMAKEEDHAHLVIYFASDLSSHVTGQVIAVDGAQSLYHPMIIK